MSKGFGIFFVNQEEKIEEINFDIISSDLTEDARIVVRGFRLLRSQEFYKQIEKDSLIIWMDCGKHFRNSEVIGYLLKDLSKEKIHGIYSSFYSLYFILHEGRKVSKKFSSKVF